MESRYPTFPQLVHLLGYELAVLLEEVLSYPETQQLAQFADLTAAYFQMHAWYRILDLTLNRNE